MSYIFFCELEGIKLILLNKISRLIMKKFTLLLILFMAVNLSAQLKSTFIRDLDGNAGISEISSGTPLFTENELGYPVYPGFPKQGLYSVISPKTGSIYCNMDSDADMEFIFGAGETLYAVNLDGTSVPGWPKTFTQYYEAVWAVSCGDVNGDLEDEIVAGIGGPLGGFIHVYSKNGTMLPGFPINVGKYPMCPVLSDIDNNGSKEIIMGTRTGLMVVYKGDGTMYPGWPIQMDRYIAASASVGDINGDGQKNIIATSRNLLYAWNAAGQILPGFPYSIIDSVNGSNSYSAPLLVDLTGNGKLEIVFGSHQSVGDGGVVYAVDYTGTSLPGWPKFMTNWIYGAPVAANIDNDSLPEILIGEYGSSITPAFYIYAYNTNGSVVPGFPLGPYFGIANQLSLVDLDGDNQFEIIFDENIQEGDFGRYTAVKLNGTPVPGWPLQVLANSSFQQPLFGDFNNDGIMDMAGGSFSFDISNKLVNFYVWNTGLTYNRMKIVNPMYQFSPSRDGIYIDPLTTPVEMGTFSAAVSGNNVILNWETVSEKNNSGFNILRNNDFVGFIPGIGTSTNKNYYSFTDNNLISGKYEYKLQQIDFDGTVTTAGVLTLTVDLTPSVYLLEQNYPNPFNPSTVISFQVPADEFVTLKVYDIIGNEIANLVNETKTAGSYSVNFDASGLANGVYMKRWC
jgi:hypothetical protein